MSTRLFVTVASGDRRVSFEIADGEVTVVEQPADRRPIVAPDAVQFLLPATPGATFAITASFHAGPEQP